MDTEHSIGQVMHGDDAESRREAARMMGKARTEKKIAASRANVVRASEANRGKSPSEETRQKLREAQAARRERERLAKAQSQENHGN